MMIKKTQKVLELSEIRKRLAVFCTHPLAKAWAENMKLAATYKETESRLFETSCAVDLKREYPLLKTGGLPPMDLTIQKIKKAALLKEEDLFNLLKLLEVTDEVKSFFKEPVEIPLFSNLIQLLMIKDDFKNILNKTIDETLVILDTGSPVLKDIRRKLMELKNKEKNIVESMTKRGAYVSYLQESIVVKRGDSYCLSVKREYGHKISGGLVQDTSSTGSTVFIEPREAIQIRSDRGVLKREEREERDKILRNLSEWAHLESADLESSFQSLGYYNFYLAKAALLSQMSGIVPDLNNAGIMEIYSGKHPLLEGHVVANNVFLGKNFHTLIITGPNTGGKTVVLKMVGLFSLMVRLGLGIPARIGTKMPFLKKIFAQIGDEQSIEQSLSTFSSHMVQIKEMVDESDHQSLLLFDELGSGTDPSEGSSLAMAILTRLGENGSRTIATTHYGELKAFAYENEGFENGSVTFDENTLSPTYELIIGTPGASLGIVVAERYGLDSGVIEMAKNFQQEGALEVSALIVDLDKTRNELKEETLKVNGLKEELTRARESLERDKDTFEEKSKVKLQKEQKKAERELNKLKVESEKIIEELKEQFKNRPEITNQIRKKIKGLEKAFSKTEIPKAIKGLEHVDVGDLVMVYSVNKEGTVDSTDNHKKTALVKVGIMSIKVPFSGLGKIKTKETEESVMPSRGNFKRNHVATEIDLRGQNVEEGVYLVDKYLDDAYLGNYPFVRIIHGKGTGVLQKGIWAYLKKHPHVKEFRLGETGEGGTGVTVVYFK